MRMDVKLPEGTTYILVIDTDKYSGNFEREMCGYVTGIFDEERWHGNVEAAQALAEAPELVASLKDKVTQVLHTDYGRVSNTIRGTPNRINMGGVHRDALPNETGWTAYESVAIFFEKPLTMGEMENVRHRAIAYGNRHGIVIKAVCLVEVVIRTPVETVLLRL